MAAKPIVSTTLISDPNLFGYWQLNGDSTDYTGSRNGTDTAISYNASFTPFAARQGASFNGSTSKIKLGTTNLISSGNFLWIHAWVNIQGSAADWATFFGSDNTTSGSGYFAGNKASAAFPMDLITNEFGNSTNQVVSNSLSTGTWYMIDGVFNVSAKTYTIYLNNVKTAGGAIVTFAAFNWGQAYIGAATWAPIFFNGYAADVAVFNRLPTDAEINGLYNGFATSSMLLAF